MFFFPEPNAQLRRGAVPTPSMGAVPKCSILLSDKLWGVPFPPGVMGSVPTSGDTFIILSESCSICTRIDSNLPVLTFVPTPPTLLAIWVWEIWMWKKSAVVVVARLQSHCGVAHYVASGARNPYPAPFATDGEIPKWEVCYGVDLRGQL